VINLGSKQAKKDKIGGLARILLYRPHEATGLTGLHLKAVMFLSLDVSPAKAGIANSLPYDFFILTYNCPLDH